MDLWLWLFYRLLAKQILLFFRHFNWSTVMIAWGHRKFKIDRNVGPLRCERLAYRDPETGRSCRVEVV